ncbi:MAG: CAP domain-containing protein [Phycisphaerales bacterium]|nr:MAG: CAP domain-containing protein [Phycisphaerales bacterium]
MDKPRNRNLLYAILLSVGLAAGCADNAATQTLVLNTAALTGIGGELDGVGGACGIAQDEGALVARVIELVNEERTKIGVAPVSESDLLRQVAAQYACRMVEEGFFSHYDSEGEGPGERAVRGGYVFMKLGENLAAGQTTAEQVVAEWMASDQGHRENILSPEWRETGVAVRLGGQHGVYWVQEFGDPPGR